VAGRGINDVVEHYAAAISALPAKPVVIGHSFGGLIAQKLLAQGLAEAAVAIDAAPIKGVLLLPPSALRVASIALRNPLNRGKSVSLTEKQFRYGFGNAVSAAESAELWEKWAIPSPAKPLFEAAAANFLPNSPAKVDTANSDRGPLLLIAGGSDRTVPASVTRQTRRLYGKSTAVTTTWSSPAAGTRWPWTAAGARSATPRWPGSAPTPQTAARRRSRTHRPARHPGLAGHRVPPGGASGRPGGTGSVAGRLGDSPATLCFGYAGSPW